MIRTLLIVAALASSHRSLPAFAGCLPSAPQVRPSALLVSCPDGTLFLAGLQWSRWDRNEARATGVAGRNDCVPDCRSGRVKGHPVVVRLYRARTCSNGRREFTRMTFTGGPVLKSPFYSGAGCP
ncbi:MAG TPA: hypothetical protein VGG88_02715 [Gaiellaceae bacterium]